MFPLFTKPTRINELVRKYFALEVVNSGISWASATSGVLKEISISLEGNA